MLFLSDQVLTILAGRDAAVFVEGAVEGAFTLEAASLDQFGGGNRRIAQEILRQLHAQGVDVGVQAAANLIGEYARNRIFVDEQILRQKFQKLRIVVLYDRVVIDASRGVLPHQPIDWSVVEQKLRIWQELSLNYLAKALCR